MIHSSQRIEEHLVYFAMLPTAAIMEQREAVLLQILRQERRGSAALPESSFKKSGFMM